ncbi:PREDICTED: trigger factor-like [Priapulus caudatus]|uniref:Trigger factor-like n=1 Tax=Priapulus caudatus TaxID=37621 RepID=A0ABM1DRZ1_PRICU|nr:PREDICTED: trigger factor-like [Priapulus caudatus]
MRDPLKLRSSKVKTIPELPDSYTNIRPAYFTQKNPSPAQVSGLSLPDTDMLRHQLDLENGWLEKVCSTEKYINLSAFVLADVVAEETAFKMLTQWTMTPRTLTHRTMAPETMTPRTLTERTMTPRTIVPRTLTPKKNDDTKDDDTKDDDTKDDDTTNADREDDDTKNDCTKDADTKNDDSKDDDSTHDDTKTLPPRAVTPRMMTPRKADSKDVAADSLPVDGGLLNSRTPTMLTLY